MSQDVQPVRLRVELDRLRQDCQRSEDCGPRVLQAVADCIAADIPLPQWLGEQVVARVERVKRADCLSWADREAFGSAWPARTRRAIAQRNVRMRAKVHAAVWQYAQAHPEIPFGDGLFKAVARQMNAGMGQARVRDLYYAAVSAGSVNVAKVRRASASDLPALGQLSRNCALLSVNLHKVES